MDGEDAEHDLVRAQGQQQLYPLNHLLAAILYVAQTLAAHSDAPLDSILSPSVKNPEVVRGLDPLLTHSLHQGHGHRDPVLPRLQGGAAQHEGVQEVLCTLTRPASKGVSNLDKNKYEV